MDIKQMNEICFIGLGYIGLPTASLMAVSGHTVTGVDINPFIVKCINSCTTEFNEPGLNELVTQAVRSKKFRATTSVVPADIFVIAVPTPVDSGTAPDMSFVKAAVESLAPCLATGNLVILESTSPIGATEQLKQWVVDSRGRADDILFAYSPERIIPGNMIKELQQNDRVIGGLTPEATKKAADFYRTFVRGQVMETTARTAELTKLAENSYRDTNIAFANELSIIAEKNDIDPWELIHLTNCHPRVNILQPSPGVGGHCIAIDPWFLVHAHPEDAQLIATARRVNLRKTEYIYDKIMSVAAQHINPVIACMGLTYKPNADDLRESPALELSHRLMQSADFTILCAEPNCSAVEGITLVDSHEAMLQADIVVWLVKHTEFIALAKQCPKTTTVIDTCGVTHV